MHKPDTLSWLFRKSSFTRAFQCARLDKRARGARNFHRGNWNRDTLRGREARFSSWFEFVWLCWNPDTQNFRNTFRAPIRRRLCPWWRLKCIRWKRNDLHRLLMWLRWQLLHVPPFFPGACTRTRVMRITPIIDRHEWPGTMLGSRIQASTAEPYTTHCVKSLQPTQSAAFRPSVWPRSV